MSLVSHLVGIIEHQGTLDEQCEKCSQAIAVAQAEDALQYPGAPNVNLTSTPPTSPDNPVLP